MHFINCPTRAQKGCRFSFRACSQSVTPHSSRAGLHVVLREKSRDSLMSDADNEHGAIKHICTVIRLREYAPVRCQFLLQSIIFTSGLIYHYIERHYQISLFFLYFIFSAVFQLNFNSE